MRRVITPGSLLVQIRQVSRASSLVQPFDAGVYRPPWSAKYILVHTTRGVEGVDLLCIYALDERMVLSAHHLLHSPVELLPCLSSRLLSSVGSSNSTARNSINPEAKSQLRIKREDSNSGLAGGGNKIRKLEYVVPDALAQGATTLVTSGGLQSNHMRQITAVASKLRLKAVTVFNLFTLYVLLGSSLLFLCCSYMASSTLRAL